MIRFKINMKGIEKGRKLTIDKSKRVLMKSMFKMEELAIRRAPFDKGFLRQNITLFPQILSNRYVLRSMAPYSADLEFGNTPRDVRFEDIEAWVIRKGIRTGKNVVPFALYVQNKIKTKGVNAQPFMRPSFWEIVNFWQDTYKKEEFSNN